MSDTTKTWPHQDLMAKNSITEADLPEKTKKKLAKFAAADDESKEALDEVLWSEIDDVVDAKAKAQKAAEKSGRYAEHKKATTDVSGAPTAQTQQQQNPDPNAKPEPKKTRSYLDMITGRPAK